jgi:hypothetical protein
MHPLAFSRKLLRRLLGVVAFVVLWGGSAAAQTIPVVAPAGAFGTDYSVNPQSLAGLNLLGFIPVQAANTTRRGYIVQAQDSSANCSVNGGANGLIVALDDGGVSSSSLTVLTLSYASAKGGQGGSITMPGIPHTGRIRFYGTSGCQVGAHAW